MRDELRPDDPDSVAECQRTLGYWFRDPKLLQAALTHSSSADHPLASNERLEFLGDAVLGLVVCETLYDQFAEFQEGELTRIKSAVVSRETCSKMSRRLGMQRFLIMGKGMGSPSQVPASTLANVFESIVGAIYLDGGLAEARRFILRCANPEIEAAVLGNMGRNYKSQFQQIAQRTYGATPTYFLLDEKGPDHQKCFKIAARVGSLPFAPAWGMNKKDAEQRAAQNAISQIQGHPLPYPSD